LENLGKLAILIYLGLAVISWTPKKVLGDKAYKGDEAIATPHKKLRKPKLNSKKQENNCLLEE